MEVTEVVNHFFLRRDQLRSLRDWEHSFITWFRAAHEGPPGSHVTHVAEEWGESDARASGFAIRKG